MSLFRFILPFLLLFSCEESDPPVVQTPMEETPVSPNAKTYLALGDSYTIGEKVEEEDRFPNLLTTRLRGLGFDMAPAEFIAQTGWRTDHLIDAIAKDREELNEPYDLVTLLIGVNNQFQDSSLEVYKVEFLQLLNTAIELAGDDKDRVLVLSIPDYAFTPFGQMQADPDQISEEIDAFNAANREICLNNEVFYFDFTALSRQGLTDEALIGIDGLHPSGKMYSIWVNSMVDKAALILE